ncbi:MAG: Uma2 family endonuclease [Planctomycetes bacterium]|nr:Uma2 family endonuclease [Planctomycetota bacterium]
MSTLEPAPQLTYADYLAFPDDGQRHELLAGVHVVNPAPRMRHQLASTRLSVALDRLVTERGAGVVVAAPIDVRLSDEDGVQPDLAVVLRGSRARVRERGIDGPPDLVVEILSRATRRLDLGPKRDRYERLGVGEYWIVDLDRRCALRFARAGDRFAEPTEHRNALPFAALGGGADVDLRPVWASGDAVDD